MSQVVSKVRAQQDAYGWRKRLHAWLMSKSNARHERAVAAYKRELLGQLSGQVVEIGPGGGVNLEYYPRAVHWTGVEPNPYMHGYLRAKAQGLGLQVDLQSGDAQHLEFSDNSADAVVGTLVLCSVEDPALALREVKRILRPGGKFVFLEHVAAPPGTSTRRRQAWIRPCWKWMGDGCSPDRETWKAIEQAGFESLDLRHFRIPLPIIGPHIAGLAIKS